MKMNNLRSFSAKAQRLISKYYSDQGYFVTAVYHPDFEYPSQVQLEVVKADSTEDAINKVKPSRFKGEIKVKAWKL